MGRDGRRHGPFNMGGGCQNYAPSLGTFCCKGHLEKGIQVVVVLVTMMLTTYHIGFESGVAGNDRAQEVGEEPNQVSQEVV